MKLACIVGCTLVCATGGKARAQEVERDAVRALRFNAGVPIADLALVSSGFEYDFNPDNSQTYTLFCAGIALGYAYAPIPYFAVGAGWEWRHPLWLGSQNIDRFQLAATVLGILPLAGGTVELGLEVALGWAWQRWQLHLPETEPFEHADHLFTFALKIPVSIQIGEAWSVYFLPGGGYDTGGNREQPTDVNYQAGNIHFFELTAGVGYRL